MQHRREGRTPGSTTYVVSVEVRPRVGSQMYGVAEGAFVYCFVRAPSAAVAQTLVTSALDGDNYDIALLEWVRRYDECEWESQETRDEYDGHAAQARQGSEVVYSMFHTYAVDDD